jgi:hypothetical protein
VSLDFDQAREYAGSMPPIQQPHNMYVELTRGIAVQRDGEVRTPQVEQGG